MRHSRFRNIFIFAMALAVTGCTSFLRRGDDKQELAKVDLPETVGDATRPHGLGTIAIESIGLVTGLRGTGSDPPQSPQRAALVEEMKRREVHRPQNLLADPSTSIVVVRAFLPPGTEKGDRIDIEVRAPSRSKTSSLEGGWLMETKLRETAILNQSLHSGNVRGVAEGPILVDALLTERDDVIAKQRGRILGGGVATKSRPIGLKLRSEHHSVSASKLIGVAINRRFDTYIRGTKQGAARPKTDDFIELTVHPRYRDNMIRFLRVVEQIKIRESEPERMARLETVGAELLVPSTSSMASLKLEAIGDDATQKLLAGLDASSAEVRFHAAEGLAYLDVADAAAVLGASALREPAFRNRALLALGAMSSVEAHDQLTQLLHEPSAETRYGAFRAIQSMNARDPVLGQEVLGEQLYLHEVASSGEPMIHIARSRRREIVMFGTDQPIRPPFVVTSGRKFTIKSNDDGLRITKYTPGEPDDVRNSRPFVGDLVRNLAEVGATYPEVIDVLQQAKQQDCLETRLVFDALPEDGRTYVRDTDEPSGE